MTLAFFDPKQVRPASRPTVLYIVMEDCGPDFACYGDPFEIRNLAGKSEFAPALELLRAKMDGWVARFDHGASGEDPLDIYRGFWNRQP